jgi:ankyrin repeat protein
MSGRNFHGITAESAVDALSFAAANSMFREMGLLLGDQVDVNGVSSGVHGGTALNLAARLGLFRSTDWLIRAGADLNTTDADDLTPLMAACSLGRAKGTRVALRLIEAGADVRHVRASDGMTALKFAAGGSAELIQALTDCGA